MIALHLEFLSGRFVASAFNDRNKEEWPPHPARVFSALVAAYHEGERAEKQRAALLWLEQQPPPRLSFSAHSVRDLKTNYVPVNDKALTDTAMVQSAWSQVYAARGEKQAAKAEAKLAQAYAKASAPDAKLPKGVREVVAHLMPASRTKQPRTFPSVTPEHPHVWMAWPDVPAADVRAGLDELAAQLVRVGHSSSLVAARWEDAVPEATWTPEEDGEEVLRWVMPGQLAALEAQHAASPFAEQRVMPYTVAHYRSTRPQPRPAPSAFDPHFIVLRRVEGARLPIVATEGVADGVRRALMSHAEEPIASLISGHTPDGASLQEDHLAVVPLPNVGNRHASGDLLGVALVPPAGLSREQLRPLHVAIAAWEAATPPSRSGPRAALRLGRLGTWMLERSLEPPALYNLLESTWTSPSRVWASVTPLVFDRHPGSFDDPQPARQRRALRRAAEAVVSACARIGLPAPEHVEFDVAPFIRGSEPATRFVRRAKSPDPRPRMHVRLVFPERVRGPVLLGAGRYRGLGLLRPVAEELR